MDWKMIHERGIMTGGKHTINLSVLPSFFKFGMTILLFNAIILNWFELNDIKFDTVQRKTNVWTKETNDDGKEKLHAKWLSSAISTHSPRSHQLNYHPKFPNCERSCLFSHTPSSNDIMADVGTNNYFSSMCPQMIAHTGMRSYL